MPGKSLWYRPQLATLVKKAPVGEAWLHEIKYDGYRIGCRIDGGTVTLVSRNGNDWTAAFPEVCEAVRCLGLRQAVFDGEVAVELSDGRTSFHAMQIASAGDLRAGLRYFIFDILQLEGEDLTPKPLEARKAILRDVLGRAADARLRYSEHVAGSGDAVLEQACRLRLEGIVSKRADRPYRAGRNEDWLKTKCIARQEFVIGGYTDREGDPESIGALLIGYYDRDRRLQYAGKVGTGFTHKEARALHSRLERMRRPECPFEPRPAGWLGRHGQWVRPELVAEVAFTEWTPDRKVRHPSFQGLRSDKKPVEVKAERPDGAAAAGPVTSVPARRKQRSGASEVDTVIAGVAVSHPERVVFPETGVSKLELARYYETVSARILPHVAGRPLTLYCCPEGIGDACYYMKHSKVWAHPALRRVRIREQKKIGEYLIVDDAQALVALVQMNVIEIHTWNSVYDSVDKPNRIVIDMDPGGHVPPAETVATARLVRSLLQRLDLESYVKTTGGAGLHVVVPIVPGPEWSECLAFSKAVASAMVRHNPSLYTMSFAKKGREAKILVDYLRNNRTNTSVAAFSVRARAGAPVSVPLGWDELKPVRISEPYTVKTISRRLARLEADPWQSYWNTRQRLTATALRSVGKGI